jgi:hypothetical protein
MTRTAAPTPVWIDTDMGFDDLAAVLVVDQNPAWVVEGLSLVAGNAPLPVVEDNALRSAACFGWTFPVHAGCDKPLACDLSHEAEDTARFVLVDAYDLAGGGIVRDVLDASGDDATARWTAARCRWPISSRLQARRAPPALAWGPGPGPCLRGAAWGRASLPPHLPLGTAPLWSSPCPRPSPPVAQAST